MKRIVLVALAIMAMVPGLFAQSSAPSHKDQLYIEVSALGNLDYFYDHKMGMEMVGKELGVRTEYVGPAEYDMNAMVAAFEQAIAKKPKGIVVVGFEPSLNAIVDKAVGLGIPVVTVDADLPVPSAGLRGHRQFQRRRGRRQQDGKPHRRQGQGGHHHQARPVQPRGAHRGVQGRAGQVQGHPARPDRRHPVRSHRSRAGRRHPAAEVPGSGRHSAASRRRRSRCSQPRCARPGRPAR